MTPVRIRARSLSGFADLVRRHGGDAAAIATAVGIDPEVLGAPDSTISMAQGAALLDHAAAVLNLPDFGLKLGEMQDISVLGPVAVISRHAANLRMALEAMGRNMAYHTPGAQLRLQVDTEADAAQLRWSLQLEGGAPVRHGVELTHLVTLKFLRVATQDDGSAWQVGFRHSPGLDAAHYRKALGCAVAFDQPHDTITFPARLLDAPIDPDNDELRQHAERYVANVIRRYPLDIGGQVAALIERQLTTGICGIDLIARQLGLHRRTLQRRLREQGLYFEDIVDRLRRERATEYLPHAAIPLIEIAALLGYGDPTSFTRACRRWFEENPRTMRRRTLST